jgi:signal transduction histidine kinase
MRRTPTKTESPGLEPGEVVVDRASLERQLAQVADRERERIGQELHDGVGQHVAGLSAWLRVLRRRVECGEAIDAALLAPLIDTADEAAAEVRRLSRCLVSLEVPRDGLAAALGALVSRCNGAGAVRCRFDSDGQVDLPDDDSATQLFRIAQEAVRNALEHAGASLVVVSLYSGPAVRLEIRDDGQGIGATDEESAGAGLRILHARARSIGARLAIESSPGRGTAIVCTLPAALLPRWRAARALP